MAPVFRSSPVPHRRKAKGEPSCTGLGPTITAVLRITQSSGTSCVATPFGERHLSFWRPGCPLVSEWALSFASQPYDWFALFENDDAIGSICKNRHILRAPDSAQGSLDKWLRISFVSDILN